LNNELSWLRARNILGLLVIFVALFKPQSVLAVESEPMPLPIVENGNLLYINHQGKVIIDPKVKTKADISKLEYRPGIWSSSYNPDFIGSDIFFYDGLAAIRVNNKWGYVNKNGEIVISPQFDRAGRFRDGMASVSGREYRGNGKFVNRNGKVISIKYSLVGDFSEGLAAVALPSSVPEYKNILSQDETAYVDRSGRVVIKTGINSHHFDPYFHDFSEGLAVVKKRGYINRTGKVVIECDTNNYDCTPFRDGLAANYSKPNKKGGFINKQGELAIPMKFDGVTFFCEGLAAVVVNMKIGFINKKGDMAIEPKYELANLAQQYDYARNDANRQFYDIMPCFSDGLLIIKVDKKIGFMDKKGKIVINPTFRNASSFVGGAAFVVTDENKWGWIDKTGAFIWKSK
jgi:WG containing repeat